MRYPPVSLLDEEKRLLWQLRTHGPQSRSDLANVLQISNAAISKQDPKARQMKKVEDAVARMGEEAHRAGQIIQSLRSFIQKRAVEHHTHKVLDLLTEPLALVEPLAQRLQVDIDVQPHDASARIDCDGVMIEQVLFNLLRNALESVATQPSPVARDAVTVRIADDADGVMISVSDRGAGIADPGRLFQPFYTTKSEGMGLGLAICRTVVESHGGRLWAEGNPGGGARLSFRLPASVWSGSLTCSTQNGRAGPNRATPAESGPRQDRAWSMARRVCPTGCSKPGRFARKPTMPHMEGFLLVWERRNRY